MLNIFNTLKITLSNILVSCIITDTARMKLMPVFFIKIHDLFPFHFFVHCN